MLWINMILKSNIKVGRFSVKWPKGPEASFPPRSWRKFYVTATKKLEVDALIVKDILHSFSHFEVVLILPEIIDRAIDCQVLNKISFWDALIVSAAQSARCEKIWTEDLNPGQIFQGVKVENPLIL